MTLVPDDKDWTWVLERPCEECGFDAGAVAATAVAAMLRDSRDRWTTTLTTRADVRDRPRPDTWSPLEYGCHVRDVVVIYTTRIRRMLDEDGPHYDNWDQDQTALTSNYAGQDPAAVADELIRASDELASLFDDVAASQWARTGFRSDGAAFTVDTISRYFIHDLVHHLHDVGAAA